MAQTVFRIILDNDEIQPITVPMMSQFLHVNWFGGRLELFYLGDSSYGPVTLFIEQIRERGELKGDAVRQYLGSAAGESTTFHIFQLL